MTDAAATYGQALYDLARDEGLSHKLLEELTTLKYVIRGTGQVR